MRDDAIPPVKWSPRLTGATQPPLAYESLWSSLSRLGWLNALNCASLKAICSGRRNLCDKDLLTSDWVDSERLASLVGWQLPMAGEVAIARHLGLRASMWFSTFLRICPLCLENGYHSIWHQLLSLPVCPLDGCPMTEQCQNCGSALPHYRFCRSLFDRPFYCSVCGEPIAGAPVDWRLFECRKQPQQLEVLAPYAEWVAHVGQQLTAFRAPLPRCGELTTWCRPEALNTSFVQRASPLPAPCVPALYANVSILRWRVQMQPSTRPMVRAVDFSPLNAVLRTVLRRIVKWLRKNTPVTELQAAQAPPLAAAVDIQGRPPEVLAYHLFCLIFCQGDEPPSGLESDLWTWSLRKLPDLAITYWDNRLPRLGFRALLVGLYSGLYHLVQRSRGAGTISLWSLREVDLIDYSWEIDRNGLASGCVIFPQIDGFELLGNVRRRPAASNNDAVTVSALHQCNEDTGSYVTLLPRRPPSDLDGRYGRFRYPRKHCSIDAENDTEAICLWLLENRQSRDYDRCRLEVERLLHWAYCHQGKAFSSLKPEDFEAYRDSLTQLREGCHWVTVGRPPGQSHLAVRPVGHRLSSVEMRAAIDVICRLAFWLDEVEYCGLEVIPRHAAVDVDVELRRKSLKLIPRLYWNFVCATLDASYEQDEMLACLTIKFMYYTGMSAVEIAGLTAYSFSRQEPFLVRAEWRPERSRREIYLLPVLTRAVKRLHALSGRPKPIHGEPNLELWPATMPFVSVSAVEEYVQLGFRKVAATAYTRGKPLRMVEELALMGPINLVGAFREHAHNFGDGRWLDLLWDLRGAEDRRWCASHLDEVFAALAYY